MKKQLLVLLLAATMTAQAGQYMSGNKLLEYMRSDSPVKQSVAMGYVMGVADSHSELLCVPENVTVRQLTDVVQALLQSQPALRHEPADVITRAALSLAFPCKGAS